VNKIIILPLGPSIRMAAVRRLQRVYGMARGPEGPLIHVVLGDSPITCHSSGATSRQYYLEVAVDWTGHSAGGYPPQKRRRVAANAIHDGLSKEIRKKACLQEKTRLQEALRSEESVSSPSLDVVR